MAVDQHMDQNMMDSQRASSSSKWRILESIEIILGITMLLVIPGIGAHIASFYFDGLSKGIILYLFAFSITATIFSFMGRHFSKISEVQSTMDSPSGSKRQAQELIEVTIGFAILLVFLVFFVYLISYYYFDGLSKGIICLYAFGIIFGVFYIIGLLDENEVFFYKKSNNKRKVARVNRVFQYEDLKKATNNFGDKLGRGMLGAVYKGKLDNGTLVAVKSVRAEKLGKRVFQAEISALATVDHAHLVCLLGYGSHITETGGTFYIVYDLFSNGSLDNWIFPKAADPNAGFLSWKQRYRVAIEDGIDIYRRCSDGGNTQRQQQTFHDFLLEKLKQKKLVNLTDERLMAEGEVDDNEVTLLVYVALLCLQEDPKKRPADMGQVADILIERKVDDVTHIFKGVFQNKKYDNKKNVARFPRDFRHKELEIATNNFRDELGTGGYGPVFKGILNDGTLVIVERVKPAIYGEREFQVELAFMASIQHAHIVRFRGYCSHMRETGYIVAKYVAKALEYLHGQRICHLHIKPESVLLDGDFRAVVSDFGFSKLIRKDGSKVLTAISGAAVYMAPECSLGITSEKCDVFSYGVLLLDMFFGKRNVCLDDNGNRNDKQDGNSQEERFNFYKYMSQEVLSKGKISELIDKRLEMVNNREAHSLLKTALRCVDKNPMERPDMRGVFKILLSD
ncbi:hypothetical protein GIB67_041434 [Kingdonia uniflora]|uniref:Protein kinase domain-containing protein n=1 Tax=Kingdonia uniflora TaxID=39325 RepID=A0A7J7LRN7_9MAGN|nr:hypothetical protein GIB67_041434 [Kingdonia uniflora]